MAILTTSQANGQSEQAANEINKVRQQLKTAKTAFATVVAWMDAFPSKYADLLETKNQPGYGDTDEFEAFIKAFVNNLVTEYQALDTDATAADTWLQANTTEF